MERRRGDEQRRKGGLSSLQSVRLAHSRCVTQCWLRDGLRLRRRRRMWIQRGGRKHAVKQHGQRRTKRRLLLLLLLEMVL